MVHRRAILGFHDALAWLAQIAMFVLLGLLVFPSHLPAVAGRGLFIAAFLVLVARPLAVFVSLTPFRVPFREQAMIGWVGLRGAVPIVLATWPRTQGVHGAEEIFDIVFFVVVMSVALQGATLPYVARLLGVVQPDAPLTETPQVVRVAVGAEVDGRMLADVGLPSGALVTIIHRGDQVLVPQGSTTFATGDVAHVLTRGRGRNGRGRSRGKALAYSVRGPRLIFSSASFARAASGCAPPSAACSRHWIDSSRRPVTRRRMPRL